MIKLINIIVFFMFFASPVFAQTVTQPEKIIIFITEQSIDNSKFSWWINEMDYSVSEKEIANKLEATGFQVINPVSLLDLLKNEKVFKPRNGTDASFLKLASKSGANLAIIGQSIVSLSKSGSNADTRTCFANVTGKIINVDNGQVIGFIESSSSALNVDIVLASKDSLFKAIDVFNSRIIDKLKSVFKKEERAEDKNNNEPNLSGDVIVGNITGNVTKI